MRRITAQRILITGATSGLGKELARALATKGATLLLHGRDRVRIEAVTNKIKQETGNSNIQFYCADLGSLRQVADLAEQIGSEQSGLQVLVNNAAVGFGKDTSKLELSQDGYELRFRRELPCSDFVHGKIAAVASGVSAGSHRERCVRPSSAS
jgi:short-subunit dehydrogenase